MERTETRQIGGHEWTVTTMGADKGLEVAAELASTVVPVIGRAVGALEQELAAIGDAASELATRLHEKGVRDLIRTLCTERVLCDGKPVTLGKGTPTSFDYIFAGDYQSMIQVALFSIEVNFQLPFESLLSKAKEIIAQQLAAQEAKIRVDSLAS